MIQLHQLPKGPEDLHPQHQHDHQGAELQVPIGHSHRAPAQGHRRATGDTKDGQRTSRGIGRKDAHGGPKEHTGAFRQQFAASTALAEGFERGEALHRIQEIRAQSAIGVAAGHAALSIPTVKHVGDHQGQQGEGKEYQARPKVYEGHEYEDRHRGQRRHDHLRQVASKEGLQPLHSFRQGHQGITGACGVEVPRTKGQRMLVEPLPQLHLDQAGGMVAHNFLQVL